MNFLHRIYNKIYLTVAFSSIGANLSSKLKLCFYALLIPIKDLGIKMEVSMRVRIKKFDQTFDFCITDNSDFAVLKEIFFDNQYNVFLENEPIIIFDLGSNVGLSVIYFRMKYPDAIIYAFEPDAKSFEKLKKNVSQFKNIICYNLAVSDQDGTKIFYVSLQRSMSSSFTEPDDAYTREQVATRSLDSLMEELGITKIDLLKFDIEGAEYEVFKNFKNMDKVGCFIGELHLDIIKESKQEFTNLFKNVDIDLEGDPTGKRFIVRAFRN